MHTFACLWRQKRVSYPFEQNLCDSGAHGCIYLNALRSLYSDSLLPVWRSSLTFFSHQLNLEAVLRTASASISSRQTWRKWCCSFCHRLNPLTLFSCYSLINDFVFIFSSFVTMKCKSPMTSIHICFAYYGCGKRKNTQGWLQDLWPEP